MAGHWTHVASLTIRVLSGLIGFGFLYMAVFMYADERGKQQNRLVDLWVSVKAKEESALSTYSALIKSSSELALLGLRRLLGEKMISWWTVAVSISLSMASVCMLSFVQSSTNSSRLAMLGLGGLFLAYGGFVAPVMFRSGHRFYALALLVALWPLAIAGLIFSDGTSISSVRMDDVEASSVMMVIACVFGLSCDLLFLVVNRFIIRAMARSTSSLLLLAGVCYNLAWTVILADSVRYIFVWDQGTHVDPLFSLMHNMTNTGSLGGDIVAGVLLTFALSTNLFTLMSASIVLVVMLVAIAHRFTWPLVGRALNAFYEWEFMSSKKVQFSAGIAFLVFAMPGMAKFFERFKG